MKDVDEMPAVEEDDGLGGRPKLLEVSDRRWR